MNDGAYWVLLRKLLSNEELVGILWDCFTKLKAFDASEALFV